MKGYIMTAENRQWPRMVSNLKTIYYTEESTQQGNERMYFPCQVIDKCESGLGLKTHSTHRVDQHIWLESTLKSNQVIEARVRWIRPCDNDDEYRIGVEYFN